MQWILVKTFSFPYEAQIAKTQLIEAYTKGKKSAFMAFMFFGLPLFSFKNGNRCKQCQYFWS
ncbi:hypothetical protein [Acinetobacter seifertii]|uniref:hypothetical protein n=1 Tax=Acinetobacter seifertii TaxID=1530123 RepID=UPI001905B0C3|nr:hypothetical protein [Acinetobacter seifertii]MBJ9426053.1 hypothetical protein [Acinetobacter seifertii]